MIRGIDISHWQGKVDFHAVRDNVDFVIMKATQGTTFVDPAFIENRDGARTTDLCIGFYHYAYPQFNRPEEEADWFTKIVSCRPGEVMALDFEETYPNPVGWCKAFLDKVTSNMGFKPLVYLNLALVKSHDWSLVINAGYGLWLAYWDYNPESTNFDTPWPVVAMRQYSNKGNIAGLNPVDLNVFYGDVATFKKYGNPPPPPPSNPPIVPPYNCDELKKELDQLKLHQNDAIKQAVSTAISENDAKWQTKLDSANLTISQLQSSISQQTKLSVLLGLIWAKLREVKFQWT